MWTEIREINLISIRAADANAREFVSPCQHAHTVCMCAGIQIYLSKKDPHALYSHFVQLATFFFSLILLAQTMSVAEVKIELES